MRRAGKFALAVMVVSLVLAALSFQSEVLVSVLTHTKKKC
jgi:hypothetical protein